MPILSTKTLVLLRKIPYDLPKISDDPILNLNALYKSDDIYSNPVGVRSGEVIQKLGVQRAI